MIKWAFEKNNILSKLTKMQIEKLVENMQIKNCEPNEYIFIHNNDYLQKMIILLEGEIKTVNFIVL